jgi:HK97 family phage prohead protease
MADETLDETGVQRRLATFAQTDAAAAQVEYDDEGRQIYMCLAYQYEPAVDRYGTTMQRGAMAHVTPEDFRILAYHDQRQDPVGKPVSVEDTPDGPVVRWVFADTPRAQELRSLVDGGFLRAVSIGFVPDPQATAVRDGVTVFGKADLLELSLVNTPASPGALIQLARDMNQDPAELQTIFPEVTEERDDAAINAAIAEAANATTFAPPVDELARAVETLRAAGVSEDVLAQLVPVPAAECDTAERDAEAAGRRERMLHNLFLLRNARL